MSEKFNDSKISRRTLLKGGVLAGVAIAGKAGHLIAQPSGEYSGPAQATQPAERAGSQFQTNPPPPPPQSWAPGQFVRQVSLRPELGLHLAMTYDDGPSPYNTDIILKRARSKRLKGNFLYGWGQCSSMARNCTASEGCWTRNRKP